MAVNLFVNLDDELEAEVWRAACANGRTLEEELRKRLIEGVGGVWRPLSADDIINDDRAHIMLDLRRTK